MAAEDVESGASEHFVGDMLGCMSWILGHRGTLRGATRPETDGTSGSVVRKPERFRRGDGADAEAVISEARREGSD